MKWAAKMRARWRWRQTGMLALAVAWTALLLGAAVPAWRQAERQHQEIQRLDEQLAELDRWAVAGRWLERSLQERAPEVDRVWNGLFPERRDREALFLELARIADASGIADFDLVELEEPRMAGDNLWLTRLALPAGATSGDQVQLSFYRVQANFLGDYQRVARFLGGLRRIERALSVHSMEVVADRSLVRVDLKLDVYVKQSTQS